jgi:AsmA protein
MIDTIKTAERDNLQQKLTELKPQAGDETRFSELSGTAQIRNGVVQNSDLKIKSSNLLDITGKGSADLPKETLDYTVTSGKYGVIMYGPFSQLKFKPDLSAIVKGKVEEKKSEIKEKLQEKLKDRFKLR